MNANLSLRMEPTTHAPTIPFDAIAKGAAGVAGTLVVLFVAYDIMLKVCEVGAPFLGSASVGMGACELALLAVYLIQRTAVVGAVLWTGYLAAVAGPALLPVVVAFLLWLPLALCDKRARALFKRTESVVFQ